MKTIDEIKKMSFQDLERVSMDEGIPVPESIRFKAASPERTSPRPLAIGLAASLVLLAGIGLWRMQDRPLQDTYSDPYLAYAEVEKAFGRIGKTVGSSAETINDCTVQIENRIINIIGK